MAAELPYASDPNHKPAASAPAPAPATTRRISWATVATVVFLALNFALCVRRVQDDRGAVAFVGVSHLNLALLFCALRWFEVAPHGSPARGRARLAVWLLTTTLTAAFTWKVGAVLPLGLAIAAWVAAAATVGGGFYVIFLHDEEKPSESLIMRDCEKPSESLIMRDCERPSESLIMRDCERDEKDLWVLAS